METLWWGKVPLHVQTELEKAGGLVETNFPMLPKVTMDRELLSGLLEVTKLTS
jgi:hypothetical protein